MINSDQIFAYQILINIVTLVFLTHVYRTLAPSKARFWFTLETIVYLIYANLLCVFYFPITNAMVATYFSKSLFAVSILYTSTVVHLLFLLSNPSAIKKFHYRTFQTSQLFFFIISFTALIQNGVKQGAVSFVPIYGPMHWPFIIMYLFWWVYAFSIAYSGFRKLENHVLRKQAGAMIITVLLVFSLTLTSNGIIPAIYGSSQLSLLGSVWFLFFIIGVGIILIKGKQYNINSLLTKLLNSIQASNPENLPALQQSLLHLAIALDGSSYSFKKKMPILTENGSKTDLYISRLNKQDDEILDISKTIPMKWLEGMIDSMAQLERDNFGLALGLQKVLHTDPDIFRGEIAKYLPESMQDALNADGVTKLLAADMASKSNLTPLEISEKRVIMHYLAKNKYNKNKTRKELDITVNTLNSKILKYKIQKNSELDYQLDQIKQIDHSD